MACKQLPIGRGTDIRVMVMNGQCAVPILQPAETFKAITLSSSAIADAATLSVTALPIAIPKNNYLNFVDPVTGAEALVKVTSDAAAGATTVSVQTRHLAIPDGSVAQFPPRFKGRTSSDVDIQGNAITSFYFEDDAWATSNNATLTANLNFNGDFLDTDASVYTVLDGFIENLPVYAIITLRSQTPAYGRGTQFKGQIVPTGAPINIPSDAQVTLNFSAQFTGKPSVDRPLVV